MKSYKGGITLLLVLDIGNTNTVLGIFENKTLQHEWRMKTDAYKTEDEFAVLLKSLFQMKDVSFDEISGIIISSVVPPIMRALEVMCKKYFHVEPIIVEKEVAMQSIEMAYPNPHEIGADRIVNAVGALQTYDAPLIIVDFGTATTFCYVDENRAYHGGLITPGLKISIDALYSKASKLPKVEIAKPDQVIGQSTVEAMQAGIYYGYASLVDGIINKMKESIGREDIVVLATGGLAKLIAKEANTIHHVEEYLTLQGLCAIYEQNKF